MSSDAAVVNPIVAEETADKKVKSVKSYTPAPMPGQNAWGDIVTEVPITSLSITSIVDEKKKKKSNNGSSFKSFNNSNWVPIKATISVSSPKNNGNKNDRKNLGKNSKNDKTGNKSGNREHQRKVHAGQSNSNNSTTSQSSESNAKSRSIDSQQDKKSFNNGEHQKNGFQKKRTNFNGRSNSGRNVNGENNKFHTRPQYFGRFNNKRQHFQQNFSMQPVIMAVNNVASQIEYYFSEENLSKDEFLKGKLSKDGYVSVSVISKFFRIVNLSFGGDVMIIMAALREIVANENATVDVALGKIENEAETEEVDVLQNYFIRSKTYSPAELEQSQITVTIEKLLSGQDLDHVAIAPAPVPEISNEASNETMTSSQLTEPTHS